MNEEKGENFDLFNFNPANIENIRQELENWMLNQKQSKQEKDNKQRKNDLNFSKEEINAPEEGQSGLQNENYPEESQISQNSTKISNKEAAEYFEGKNQISKEVKELVEDDGEVKYVVECPDSSAQDPEKLGTAPGHTPEELILNRKINVYSFEPSNDHDQRFSFKKVASFHFEGPGDKKFVLALEKLKQEKKFVNPSAVSSGTNIEVIKNFYKTVAALEKEKESREEVLHKSSQNENKKSVNSRANYDKLEGKNMSQEKEDYEKGKRSSPQTNAPEDIFFSPEIFYQMYYNALKNKSMLQNLEKMLHLSTNPFEKDSESSNFNKVPNPFNQYMGGMGTEMGENPNLLNFPLHYLPFFAAKAANNPNSELSNTANKQSQNKQENSEVPFLVRISFPDSEALDCYFEIKDFFYGRKLLVLKAPSNVLKTGLQLPKPAYANGNKSDRILVEILLDHEAIDVFLGYLLEVIPSGESAYFIMMFEKSGFDAYDLCKKNKEKEEK